MATRFVMYLSTEIGLRHLAHLGEHHRADLLGREGLALPLVLHLYLGFAAVADHAEGPVLHVSLDLGVVELAPDQAFGVEHRVAGVHRHLEIN